jgi:uncharacterized protein
MSGVGASPSVASIHIYPLKAARAVDLSESLVEPWGLVGDRRWLVVDEGGRFVSQREEPALARVVARYPEALPADQALNASPRPAASPCPLTVSRRSMCARRPRGPGPR